MGTTTALAPMACCKASAIFQIGAPKLAGVHQFGLANANGRFVDSWAESAGPISYEGLSGSVGPLGKG